MKRRPLASQSCSLLPIASMFLLSSCGIPIEPLPRLQPSSIITQTDTNYYRDGKVIFSAKESRCPSTWDSWVTNCAYKETIQVPVISSTDDPNPKGSLQLNFICYSLNNQAKLVIKINETTISLGSKPVTQRIDYRTNGYQNAEILNLEVRGNWDDDDMINQDCTVSLVHDWNPVK